MTERNIPPAHLMYNTTWRHKKRGTKYYVLLTSRMQSAIPEMDDKIAVTYRCQDTQHLYTRTYDEFTDGRFERVS